MVALPIRTKNLERAITWEKLLEAALLLNTDPGLFAEAWGIFKARNKRHLSFTDCGIIAALQRARRTV
jgi:predicted nucleic acid-binding protein